MRFHALVPLFALGLFGACAGVIGDESNGVPEVPEVPPGDGIEAPPLSDLQQLDPARATASEPRRITPLQYRNAVRDMFDGRVDSGRVSVQSLNLSRSGYSTDPLANVATVDALQQLYEAAETSAESALGQMDELLPCAASGRECVNTFVDRYVRVAYRRTPSAEERASYLEAYDAARDAGFDAYESFAVLIVKMLQAPAFLYVTERGEAVAEGRRALSNDEIATRLAFLLTDSVPDEPLRAAAQSGLLRDANERRAQAERLLAMRPNPLLRRFVREWLHIQRQLDRDGELFPAFDDALYASFEEELYRTFERAFEDGRTLDELFSGGPVAIDARLAEFYGVEDFVPGPDGWAEVELGARYGSWMARPAFLASQSRFAATSIVHRGYTIMTQILCATVAPPPPNPEELEPSYPPMSTRREKSELLRNTTPACAGCHEQIDPIGLSLENYDAIGAWRELTPDTEGSQVIDDSGYIARAGDLNDVDISGDTFRGAQGLSDVLASSEDVTTCVTRHAFRYALHRLEMSEEDWRMVGQMRRSFVEGERTLAGLFLSIVESDAFIYRTVQEDNP